VRKKIRSNSKDNDNIYLPQPSGGNIDDKWSCDGTNNPDGTWGHVYYRGEVKAFKLTLNFLNNTVSGWHPFVPKAPDMPHIGPAGLEGITAKTLSWFDKGVNVVESAPSEIRLFQWDCRKKTTIVDPWPIVDSIISGAISGFNTINQKAKAL
jgi:hypothetical protein